MAILQSTEVSGSLSISGSLTAQSFVGDGSSITGVTAETPAGTVSGSAQVVALLGSHTGTVSIGDATVATANAAADDFTIDGEGTAVGMTISNSSDAGTGTIFFGDSTDSAAAGFRYNHNTGDMAISAEDNITITADNVGIGTTSPSAKLHIIGTSANDSVLINGGADARAKILGTTTAARFDWQTDSHHRFLQLIESDGRFRFYDQTNGAERVTISSSGKVGIGTTSPFTQLHVDAGANYPFEVNSTQDYMIGLSRSGTDEWWFKAYTDGRFAIHENGVGDKLTIQAGGDTGINTNSPNAVLEIEDGGTSNTQIVKITADDADPYGLIVGNDSFSTTDYEGLGFLVSNDGIGTIDARGTNTQFRIRTGATPTERLRINTSGKVGIGTTTVEKTFTVEFSSEDTTVTTGNGLAGGAEGDGVKIQNNSSTAGTYANLDFRANNADGRIAYKYMGTTNVGDFHFITDNTNSPLSAMVIKNDGKVGIGTTSPSATLHLSDAANSSVTTFSANGRITMRGDGVLAWGASANQGHLTWATGYAIVHALSGQKLYLGAGGSTDNIVIDTSGNVGIGTTSPTQHISVTERVLHIQNSNAASINLDSTGTGGKTFVLTSITGGNFRIYDDDAGAYRMAIDTNGNVGIGTTSPGADLHIGGQEAAAPTAGSVDRLHIQPYSNTGGPYKFIARTVNGSSDFLDMYYGSNHIISYGLNGNVGIGTSSPSRTLNVDGGSSPAARFQTTSDATIELVSTNSWTGIKFADSGGVDENLWYNGTYGTFALGGGGSVVSGKKLHIDGGVSIGSNSDALSVPTDGLYVEGDLTVGGIVTAQEFHTEFVSASIIYTSGSTKFGDTSDDVHEFSGSIRVSGSGDHYFSDGNVGIGTTSPGAKLTVAGSAISISNGWTGSHDILFVGGSPGSTGAASQTAARIRSTASAPGGAATGDLLFTVNSGDTLVDALYIEETGNVGIGTTTPGQTLEIHNSDASDYTDFGLKGTGHKYVIGVGNDSVATVNDKLYFYDNDNTAFRMVLDTSGNVGIGTTSPGAQLHIVNSGNGATSTIKLEDNAREMFLGRDQIKVTDLDGTTSQNLYIQPSGNTAFATTSGNVGIGTTSPASKLHVSSGDIRITNNSPSIYFYDSDVSGLYHRILGGGNKGLEYSVDPNNATAGYHRWDIGGTVVAQLIEGGNFGLGTTTPDSKLHLQSASATGAIINLETTHTSGIPIFNLKGAHSAQVRYQDENGNNQSRIDFTDSGSFNFIDATSGTSHMYISTAGNVGIGTVSPANHISGTETSLHIQNSNVASINLDSTGGSGRTFVLASVAGGSFFIYDDDADSTRLILDSSGNVGIGGTTTTGWANKQLVLDAGANVSAAFVMVNDTTGRTATDGSVITLSGSDMYLIQRESANMIFRTANTERMRIVSSGAVGINNSSPDSFSASVSTSSSLVIGQGTSGVSPGLTLWQGNSAQATINFASANTGAAQYEGRIRYTRDTGVMDFRTNSVDNVLVLNASGNVGIGTSSASQKITIGFADDGTDGLSFRSATYANLAKILVQNESSSQNGNIQFHTRSGGDVIERMRIDSSGNVGIGTTSPNHDLHIEGGSAESIINLTTTGYANGLDLIMGTDGHAAFWLRENSYIHFGTNGTERMRILSGGNVGIGTTNPGAKLDVQGGSIKTSGIVSWNDGVGALSYGTGFVTVETNTATGLRLKTNGSDRLTILSDGTVGIGNTDPNVALDVSGEVAIRGGEGADDARMYFRASDKSNRFTIETDLDGTTSNDLLGFRSTDADNILVLKGNGNIGLGTTSPRGKLDVLGGIYTYNGIVSHAGTYTDGGTYTNQWQKVLEHTFSAFSFANFKLTVMEGGDTSNGNVNADVYIHYKNQNGALRITATIVNYGNRALLADNFEIYRNNSTNKLTIYHKIPNNYTSPTYTISAGQIGSITWYGTVVGASLSGETNDSFTNKIIINGITVDADNSGKVGIGTTTPSANLDVVGGGGYASPTLELNSSTSTTFNHAINAFNSNLTSGENQVIVVGKEGSTKNSGYIGYTWNGAGSNSNLITFGHWDNNNLVNIDGLGNVGIGTTSPTSKLHIEGAGKFYSTIGDADNVRTGLAHYDNSSMGSHVGGQIVLGYKYKTDGSYTEGAILKMYKENGTSGQYGSGLKFQVRNHGANLSTKMILDPSGNLGIGTSSPAALLHINGAGDAIRVESTNTGVGGAQMDLIHFTTSPADNDVHGSINFGGYYSGTNSAYGSSIRSIWTDVSAREGQLEFYTRDDAEFAARMAIDKDGNVGIGTTSPGAKLEVLENGGAIIRLHDPGDNSWKLKGDANFHIYDDSNSDYLTILNNGNVGIGNTSPASILNTSGANQGITHDDSTTGKGYIRFRNGGTQLALFGIAGSWEGSSLQDTMIAAETGHNIRFYTNGTATPKMFISDSGNVGIGTTSPGRKLHLVNGQIKFENTSTGGWAGLDFAVGNGTYDGYMGMLDNDGRFFIDVNSNGEDFTILQNGNVGIGTTSPGGKLAVAGNIEATDQVSVNNRTAISVAHWANGASSSTGAIKIQIPGSHSSNWSMLVLRITAYEYNSTAATVYYVSGHDWTTGWYNNGVTKIGTSNKDVSLGYDSNYDYVIVGGTSSTWNYGHVTVDVVAHPSFYSGAMDITTGWAISQVTSLSGITVQSVTNKRVLTTSDEGSGNGIDADLLDGQHGSYYTDAGNLTGTIPDVFSADTRYNIGLIDGNSSQTRDKLRVWDSGHYTIGMKSGYSYGHLGGAGSEYAMSFQMNNTVNRGFWWGDDNHTDAQGAMSLTNDGKLTVATSVSIGEGESITSPSTAPLYVEGSGSTIFDVQGSQGQLFSVTDDLTGTLFSVNDISGIPILSVDSDDTVTMGTFGTNALVVTGSNVGIGTASPASVSKLHVVNDNGQNGTVKLGGSEDALGLVINYDQSSATTTSITSNPSYTNTSALMILRVDGDSSSTANQLVLKGDGNVGIGTTSPSKKLDVRGEVALDIMPNFQQAGAIRIGRSDGTSRYHEIVAYNDSTAANNYLRFDIHNGTEGSNVEVLTLKGDGNVGIGTNSPNRLLEISKTGGADFGITSVTSGQAVALLKGYASGTNVDATTSRGSTVNLMNLDTTNGNTNSLIFHNSNELSTSYILGVNVNHSSRTGDLVLGTANGSAPTERMRITSGGNVGIGNTSPDELLHVAKTSGDTVVAVEANAGNAALYLTSAGSGKDNRIVSGNGKDLKFETQTTGTGQGQGQDPVATGTTVMTLTPNGDLTLEGSIKFNGDTAAANALDDYEEGTWTPVYGSSVATVSTVTYDTDVRFGRYTKVGNMVTAWGRIRTDFIDWSSTSGAVYVGGFPYTPATILSAGTVTFSAAISRANSWAGDDPWFAGLVSGQDRMYLYYKTAFSGTTSNITPADMSDSANNNDLCFSISYRV